MATKYFIAFVIVAALLVSGCAGQQAPQQAQESGSPRQVTSEFPFGWQIVKTVNDDLAGISATGTTTWYKKGAETLVVSKATFTKEGDAKKYYDAQMAGANTKEPFSAGDGAFISTDTGQLWAYGYKNNVKISISYKNTPDETYKSKDLEKETEIIQGAMMALLV